MSEQSFVFQVDGPACVWVTVQAEDVAQAEAAVLGGEGEGWSEVQFEPKGLEVVLSSQYGCDPMTDEDEDAALAELNATPGDVEAEAEGRGNWVHEDFDEWSELTKERDGYRADAEAEVRRRDLYG